MFPLTPDQHHWLEVATEDGHFHVLSLCTEGKEWPKDLNIVKLAGHHHTTTRDRLKSEQANTEEFDTFQETWIPLHKRKRNIQNTT